MILKYNTMKKILTILTLSLLWIGLSAQSWPEVITSGMQGNAFRDSINKHLDWKSDSLTTVYGSFYTGGDGINVSAGRAISIGSSINPTNELQISLDENEFFSVSNSYGLPPNDTKIRLSKDSIRIAVDENASSSRLFYLDMTDTDFDMMYDDGDVYTGGGGVRIDTNKVQITFRGVGTLPANSRLYVEEDSIFISSFDAQNLQTNEVAASSNGLFFNADSIYYTNQKGTTDEILFIRSTGTVGSDPILGASKALDVPLPIPQELLSDRDENGEIKWLRYNEDKDMVWEYGLPSNPAKAISSLMAANEINLRLIKQLNDELKTLKIIVFISLPLIILGLLIVLLRGLIKGLKL